MTVKERYRKPLVFSKNVIEQVGSFTYLVSVVSKEGVLLEDVRSWIKKANGLFVQLYPIWKNKNLSRRTKIRLFSTNVKSVLVSGSETWKLSPDLSKPSLIAVHDASWRSGGLIGYLTKILLKETDQLPIHIEIRKRKWKWIGHTLREPDGGIKKDVLQ